MMHLLQLFRRKTPEPIAPEIEMIMGELDDWLAREHELLDDLGETAHSVGDLLRNFAQRCKKIALVGSHRRCHPNPGDVDILFVPKSNLQVIEFLEQAAEDEAKIKKTDNRWTCMIRGFQVEFIQSTENSWGMDMVQYTGSREFNQRVARHASRRGYRLEDTRPVVVREDSYNTWVTNPFSGWTEEEILVHLGLEAFLDPRKREGSNAVALAVATYP